MDVLSQDDDFYDSDGAGPCTQAPFAAHSSPEEGSALNEKVAAEADAMGQKSTPGLRRSETEGEDTAQVPQSAGASLSAAHGYRTASDETQLDGRAPWMEERELEIFTQPASICIKAPCTRKVAFLDEKRVSAQEWEVGGGSSIENGVDSADTNAASSPIQQLGWGMKAGNMTEERASLNEILVNVGKEQRAASALGEGVSGANNLPMTAERDCNSDVGAEGESTVALRSELQGTQRGALATSKTAIPRRAPDGKPSSGRQNSKRRGGVTLEGLVVAVSPAIRMGAACKDNGGARSFFLVELLLVAPKEGAPRETEDVNKKADSGGGYSGTSGNGRVSRKTTEHSGRDVWHDRPRQGGVTSAAGQHGEGLMSADCGQEWALSNGRHGREQNGLTSSEGGQNHQLTSAGAQCRAKLASTFLYFDGDEGVKWRPMCVSNAGEVLRFTGMKRRTMVVGQGRQERVVYTLGRVSKIEVSEETKGVRRGGHCFRDGAELRRSNIGAVKAKKGSSGEEASLNSGAKDQWNEKVGGKGLLGCCEKARGQNGPEEAIEVGEGVEERGPTTSKSVGQGQAGEGPGAGSRRPQLEDELKGLGGTAKRGKGELCDGGTICYVGTATRVWSEGLVVELDGRLNLLLTHYPVAVIPGLRVGSLLATWHVHPIRNEGRVVALGACTHSLVTGLDLSDPNGLDIRLAALDHPLRQLCDRVPFSMALWIVELERSLHLKLTGRSDGSRESIPETRQSCGGFAVSESGVLGGTEAGVLRLLATDLSKGVEPFGAAGVPASQTKVVKSTQRGSNAADSSKPVGIGVRSKDRVASGVMKSTASGTLVRGLRGSSAPRANPLVEEVAVHLLPGFKGVRQRRDVFEEFMAHDPECKLGVDPPGWKPPPGVLDIGSLLEKVQRRGQSAVWGRERVLSDELATALLGYLKVDLDTGRAVLADATGSVRVQLREQLEAVHLGRWFLVSRFTVGIQQASSSMSPECCVFLSLTDAQLINAAPPHTSNLQTVLKSMSQPTYGGGTWLRQGVREGARHGGNDGHPARGREAATWQSERETGGPFLDRDRCSVAGGMRELAGQPPFWMVSIISKTPLLKSGEGLRFAAEAVLLPCVLFPVAAEAASVPDISTDMIGGFLKQRSVPLTGFAALRNLSRLRNPQTPTPRSGLVRSYHQATAKVARQTSGPPWLVPESSGESEGLGGGLDGLGGLSTADTCLYTPAWERKHRPISQVKTMVNNSVNLPLVKCNGRLIDGSSHSLPGNRQPGGAGLENFMSGGGAQIKSLGQTPERNESWGVVLPNWKLLSVVPKENFSGYTEVSSGRNLGDQRSPSVLSVGVSPSGGPCFGHQRSGQDWVLNSGPHYRAFSSLEPGSCTVLGAAAAVRQQSTFVRPAKRPKMADSVGNLCAEPVKCTVYRQKLGAAGRADQSLESGPGTSALLVASEGVRPAGFSKSATDSKAGAGVTPNHSNRLVLAFSGEAALSYDFMHPGRSYLVPALQPSLRPTVTNSQAVTMVLPPPKYTHTSLPVIDLRKRESVHSFALVSSDAVTGSTDRETAPQEEALSSESPKKSQSSLLVEVPASVHRKLLPFLGASLPPEGSENPARGQKAAFGDAGMVKLRGRVVAVLQLRLSWGCPCCGSSASLDARTLRTGCVHCCADASIYTVLLREACFSVDDGTSQSELWASGQAAADLLSLPYTPVDLSPAGPESPVQNNTGLTPTSGARSSTTSSYSQSKVASFGSKIPSDTQQAVVPLYSDPAIAAGPLHGTSLRDPSKTPSSASLLNTASLANPSRTPGQATCGARLHQDGGERHQQAAVLAPPISMDSVTQIAVSVNRLLTGPDRLKSALRTISDGVKRRQRLGNSRAALYEPDALLRNLHRCLLDPSKLEALVRREGLVEVRTNPDGAADRSFQASQREMTGGRTGQLSGSDREILEVLTTGAGRQGQKILTCVCMDRPSSKRSRFQHKEKPLASGAERCRVYVAGQVHEIYAPTVTCYRALKVDPVSASTEAAALCKLLSEAES